MRTILVKWGGSLITDKAKQRTVRLEVLDRLAEELAAFLAEAPPDIRVVLGHGSGSFGHAAAHGSALVGGSSTPGEVDPAELRQAATETQLAAADLHGLVQRALLKAGVPAFGIKPGSLMVAVDGGGVLLTSESVERALQMECVALVHGDVVLDRSGGFSISSTETVLESLSASSSGLGTILGALWLGETDGLLDSHGKTLARITPVQDVSAAIDAPRGMDVTGGMAHRMEMARRFADRGVPSVLGNGLHDGVLRSCLAALAAGPEEVVERLPTGTTFVEAERSPARSR